ncbi:folylpolyglutamate synthase/dihydrofolate synthase family protein [Pricia sp.]|uniref:bifunctional folylpolyglutamate synthase/dihydrofolate synthase n=1 Tax=Pricia sp. TaxID=2268138 RepID=UPI0035931D11
MTYRETLDWMFAQLPMYQQKGKSAFNAKLDNTLAFASHLDHPEKKFKSIHVGGTNGKGSSSHMLASVLQEAGYKTGLYTSPHLKDFRERIRIHGQPVGEKFVVDFIQRNIPFFHKNQLSFFEMTVGMAFDYFSEEKVDIAIVEVGLGGRLDSTNIIVPEVALITNIGLDHVEMLGDTLAKIAFEKAGIIKGNRPIVISEYQKDTAEVFEAVANSKRAKLTYADREITKEYKTSLLGNYQAKNVKGVVAVLNELKGFKVTKDHIDEGLRNVTQNTGLMGRWQILRNHPMVVCDTAHNSEGLALVLRQVGQQHYDRLHVVLGFVKGKNLEAILPLFPKNADYYFCRPDIPRGLDVLLLKEKAEASGLNGKSYESVKNAYQSALENSGTTDFIFIGGSTFTVAEVV